MMRILIRGLMGLAAVVVLLAAGLAATAQLRWDRTFDVALPDLRASTDPDVIERGRYLVYGPAHCADCHAQLDQRDRLAAGEQPPLAGGFVFRLPFGTITTPNITPDPDAGIGRALDGELARMLRHNVRIDGRAAMPLMAFESMSDEDVVAVLSFLRAQAPVKNELPDREMSLIGKAVMAFLIKPTGPEGTPPRTSPVEAPTLERGAYLANNVANCVGCHTNRDLRDGSFVGPRFAGGFEMESEVDPNQVFVTPNLTPDARTGVMADWTEDRFVVRFRTGNQHPGSPMPWAAYGHMSDDDLRALYRYLASLDPVENVTSPVLRTRGA